MTTRWLYNVKIETEYLQTAGITSGTATKNVDLKLVDGLIAEIRPAQNFEPAKDDFNGRGLLVLPAIREMHCHFDKSKLGLPWAPIKPAASIVERFTQEMSDLTAVNASFEDRMSRLIELELANGTTFFRSHIDVHPKIGQKFLEQAQAVLAKYQGKFGYELVAFPQHGLLLSEAYDEMKRALANGAILVGGVDPFSLDGNLEKSLQQTFDLATQFNVPIDIHLHERGDAARQTYQKMMALTADAGWQNRVTISHGYGLQDFSPQESQEIFHGLVEQGISLISSVPLDSVRPPLEDIRQAGVQLALGCDNIDDSWSPFGDGSVLEKLNRYTEIYQLTTQEALTEALSLVTGQTTMGPDNFLTSGKPANFILTDSSCSAEFVARKTSVETSFYRGEICFQK
ncbi:amidohydrolase family protein [Enterococcus sp. LJL120]